MRELGMSGLPRGKWVRTTVPGKDAARAGDLLNRKFTAATQHPLGRRRHLLPHPGWGLCTWRASSAGTPPTACTPILC